MSTLDAIFFFLYRDTSMNIMLSHMLYNTTDSYSDSIPIFIVYVTCLLLVTLCVICSE